MNDSYIKATVGDVHIKATIGYGPEDNFGTQHQHDYNGCTEYNGFIDYNRYIYKLEKKHLDDLYQVYPDNGPEIN